MAAIVGAIDPALLDEDRRGSLPLTTNGGNAAPITPSLVHTRSPARISRNPKADVSTWLASNFAPKRAENESKSSYEDRLTHVTRKEPLAEACSKLGIKVPKAANLARLREELTKHWFTPTLASTSARTGPTRAAPSTRPAWLRTDESDVLASVITASAPAIHFPPPPGALPPVSTNGRGEFRGTVPLFHIGGSSSSSQAPALSVGIGKKKRAKRKKVGGSQNTSNSGTTSSNGPRAASSSFADCQNRSTASITPESSTAPQRPSERPRPESSTFPRPSAHPAAVPGTRTESQPLLPPFKSPSTSHLATRPSTIPSTPEERDAPAFGAVESSSPVDIAPFQEGDENDDDGEAALIRRFNVAGADAYELLGYDDDVDEEEDPDYEDGDKVDGGNDDSDSSSESGSGSESGGDDPHNWTAEQKHAFRIRVRVDAARRAEGNRRAGGIKTQNAMVKAWREFTRIALERGEIDDDIVDETSLLLYIQFCAERPKRTRKGQDIPGTFIGASHLKKLFFGALRIRKEQDAADPSLALKRPAVSVFVYDAIKCRMDEALERVRNGLVPDEDAPDIRANTWLSEVTDEQLERIGQGFLAHRHIRLSVFGHLAWTAQHASGNRGDDFRALKLAELQSHVLLHPDRRTAMESILGLQGEEKAGKGKRGMRTVINPVYTVFIPHLKPEMCPFGAFSFYFHYLHDEKNITETMKIDWTRNNSWRMIRVLHGPKSPTTPFNEQNMYNMYCRAYKHAEVDSHLKAHLPRHLLGYKQEALGVDPSETSRLGWVRGETYMDTYAPALPKKAILAAAGYRDDEPYDPVWRHVPVPEQFLQLVCPIAESIVERVQGKPNLCGTTNHWQMIIKLRPYLFQCGAAIYQTWPKSAIFRLPAFMDPDVRNWMKDGFPSQLALLQANAGSPVDLERIQNTFLRVALQEVRNLLASQNTELKKLNNLFQRRTAIFSPAQGFSAANYHARAVASDPYEATTAAIQSTTGLPGPRTPHTPQASPLRGLSSEGSASQGLSSLLLVEPPLAAYYQAGAPPGVFPPLLGQKFVRWTDMFKLIKQPKLLWTNWGPKKSLEQYSSIEELWTAYVDGAPEVDDSGNTTGRLKPPLKLVEQYFQASWRAPDDKKERANLAKVWERFREIPEWIDQQSTVRDVSPDIVITELQASRVAASSSSEPKGLNWLQKDVSRQRKEAVAQHRGLAQVASSSESASAESSSATPQPLLASSTTDRKRKQAIDPRRRKAKKAKTSP